MPTLMVGRCTTESAPPGGTVRLSMRIPAAGTYTVTLRAQAALSAFILGPNDPAIQTAGTDQFSQTQTWDTNLDPPPSFPATYWLEVEAPGALAPAAFEACLASEPAAVIAAAPAAVASSRTTRVPSRSRAARKKSSRRSPAPAKIKRRSSKKPAKAASARKPRASSKRKTKKAKKTKRRAK